MFYRITVTDLSTKTKEVIEMIENGKSLIILRRNKPVAAIVSPHMVGFELRDPFEEGAESCPAEPHTEN